MATTPVFKNAKDERFFRHTNPNDPYTQMVNARFQRQTAAPKPVTPVPGSNPLAAVDPNQYKTQSATIGDISTKYGFDFSRDYAKRQAEAEAQAKRNAVADAQRKNASNKQTNLKSIDNNLMSQAEGLDRNYFQQYQQQQQNQVNGGMNGGIAADQDLRMSMARQAAMGDAYRDANLGRMQENNRFTNDDLRLAEELGLVNQAALAREDSLFNERLMQGANLAQESDRFNLSQNGMLLDAAMQNRSQNIGMDQFDRSFKADRDDETRRRAEWESSEKEARKQYWDNFKRGIFESDRGYNRGVLESDRGYNLDMDKFNFSKLDSNRNYNLSKKGLDQEKAYKDLMANLSSQQQTQWTDILKEFAGAKQASLTPNLTKYYQTIDSLTGGKMDVLASKYGIQPPTVRDNKFLNDWEKMKLIGG